MSLSLVACSKDKAKSETSASTSKETPKKAERFITIDSKTIYGEDITGDYYKKNDLTLVNIMATWCGPCVREMPELQALNAADNGFGVVGIVVDTFDEVSGATIESAVEEAKNIAAATGVEYPLAVPTQLFLEQTLKKAAALLPMSFVVDQNGKVVKGPIAGARDLDAWLEVLNTVKEGM